MSSYKYSNSNASLAASEGCYAYSTVHAAAYTQERVCYKSSHDYTASASSAHCGYPSQQQQQYASSSNSFQQNKSRRTSFSSQASTVSSIGRADSAMSDISPEERLQQNASACSASHSASHSQRSNSSASPAAAAQASSQASTAAPTPSQEHRQLLLASAFEPLDVDICQRFCEMTGVGSSLSGQKLVLRTMKMLHLCKYHRDDILLIMAQASCQLDDCFGKLRVMDSRERSNVCVLQIFLSHCWLQDETCPIKVWHSNLFKQYCSLDTLQDALFKLFLIHEFTLRVDDARVTRRAHLLATGQ